MIDEVRRQHPEESEEQLRARVAYRKKHLNKRRWNLKKYLHWSGWVLFLLLVGRDAHCQVTNVNIQRQNGTLVDGTGLPIKCLSGCGGAASDTTASGVLGSLDATLQVPMAGLNSASITLPAANNLVGTLNAESSSDGGTTWQATVIRSAASTGLWASTVAVSSTNAAYNIQVPGGASHVRVRVSVYTSGTATASIRATTQPDSQPDPLVQGTQAAGSATQPNPQVMGGWDGAAVRSLKTLTDGTLLMSLPQQPFLNTTDFTDVTASSPTRGDIITAQGATPKYTRLGVGGANTVLHGSATEPAYSAVADADITPAYSGVGTPTACTNQAVTGMTLARNAAPVSTCTTLTSSFLPAAVVYNNAANTGTSAMTVDLSLASGTTGLKIPVAAGAAPTANGALAYDSTGNHLSAGINGTNFKLPIQIATGTSAMTTAGIATGACGTTVTTAATNAATTDAIAFTRNAAPTNANGGNLILNSWLTAGNVNFNYCNPSAGTVTPTAMTVNWQVQR